MPAARLIAAGSRDLGARDLESKVNKLLKSIFFQCVNDKLTSSSYTHFRIILHAHGLITRISARQHIAIGLMPMITPGMTAIIDVIGGKRTILQYILSPIERAQQIAFREK